MAPIQLLAVLQAIWPDTPGLCAERLALQFTRQSIPRGAPLLRQGESWTHAFALERGLVRMHFLRRDGREFNKNFFAEGALVCPLTPAMWSAPSLFGMTAIEPTELWRCDAQALRETLEEFGAWQPLQSELLIRLLTTKLQREHDLQALDGARRYAAFCERFAWLAERVPLVHLATYLGLTDVSLSRLRHAQPPAAPRAPANADSTASTKPAPTRHRPI